MVFKTYELPSTERNGVLKLLKEPNSQNIYAGDPEGLFVLKPDEPRLQQVNCNSGITLCPNYVSPISLHSLVLVLRA